MNRLFATLILVIMVIPMTALASDEEAAAEIFVRMDSALNSNDFDAFLSLFAEDAVEMPNGEPVLVGIEAISVRDGKFFADFTDEITTKIENVQIHGDVAIVRNSFQESWTPKTGGATQSAEGKGIGILARQSDNTWKITVLIWNNDHQPQ